jgi:hypothetical protein
MLSGDALRGGSFHLVPFAAVGRNPPDSGRLKAGLPRLERSLARPPALRFGNFAGIQACLKTV